MAFRTTTSVGGASLPCGTSARRVSIADLIVLGANAAIEAAAKNGGHETLSNVFLVNPLDMGTTWTAMSDAQDVFEGRDRASGGVKWTETRVDLSFGTHSQLRALVEVYALDDSRGVCVAAFIKAWTTVMNAGRFEIAWILPGVAGLV